MPLPARWRCAAIRGLVLLLVVGACGAAAAAPPGALPPRTRLLAGDADRTAAAAVRGLLVRGGDAAALRAAGATVVLRAGDVFVVRAPLGAIAALARVPGVRGVDAGHRLRPLLDLSAPAVGAPAARARFDVAGRGVVVGVVDTGIDTRHADFRHPDGTTRIRWLLDLSLPPTGVHPDLEQTYGAAVFDSADIDAWLQADATPPTFDGYGHGTHVAGIAAGNGAASRPGSAPGRYVGVAPEADLVVVKASREQPDAFNDADVVLGVRFVFDVAARLDSPAVANLSLGGQGGPHDGSTSMEQALAALVPDDAAGRAIVVAAGNDGAADIHASGTLRYGGDATILLDVLDYTPVDGADEYVYLELWYPADAALAVTLVSPAGRRFGPVGAGRRVDEQSPEGHVTVDVGDRGSAGSFAGTGVRVRKLDGTTPAVGRWRLEVQGTAPRWDLWLADDTLGGSGASTLVSHLDPDLHLAIPAMAEPLIAVGSFVSRNSWVTVDGEVIQRTSVPGRASWFSATGPTADGRLKPDLLAPGDFVISSLSADAYPTTDASVFYVPGQPHYLWGDDGVHAALRGTSQAAPHAAGAAALLLEAEPRLTPPELREALTLCARTDEFTAPGHAWSPRYGFGKLDIVTALRRVRGEAAGAPSPDRSAVGVSSDLLPPASTATVTVVVVPKDDLGLPLGPGHDVAIEAAGASFAGPVVDSGTGRYERLLQPGPRGVTALIVATVDGVRLAASPRVWFEDERSAIGAQLEAAGQGCAAAGAARAGGAAALLIVVLLLAGRAARKSY